MNKQTKENLKKLFSRILIFLPIIAHFYLRLISFHKNKQLHISSIKNLTKGFPYFKRLENDLDLDYPDLFTDYMEIMYILLLGLSFITVISTYLFRFFGFVLLISYSLDQLLFEKYLSRFILGLIRYRSLNDIDDILNENVFLFTAVISGISYLMLRK